MANKTAPLEALAQVLAGSSWPCNGDQETVKVDFSQRFLSACQARGYQPA